MYCNLLCSMALVFLFVVIYSNLTSLYTLFPHILLVHHDQSSSLLYIYIYNLSCIIIINVVVLCYKEWLVKLLRLRGMSGH